MPLNICRHAPTPSLAFTPEQDLSVAPICAFATVEVVDSLTAIEVVATGPAFEHVIAEISKQGVGGRVASQEVRVA